MPDIDTSPAALRALAEALVTPKLGETATVHFKALSLVKVTEMLRALAAEKEAADRGPGCEAAARVLAEWFGYAWDGLHDRDISNRYPDWVYDGIGGKKFQGGRPALRRVAQAMLAAATVKPDLTVGEEVTPLKAVAVMGVRPPLAQEASPIISTTVDLRTLAGAATPGPWQVVTYRTPFSITRHDGTTCSGEHVGRDIATVQHHPQSHAPYPIVTLGIGVTQETPVHFVFIRPEDADYLAAVSPEVVLALLDTIDALRASLAAAEKERDEADASANKWMAQALAELGARGRVETSLSVSAETAAQLLERAEKAEAERDAARWQPIETAPRDRLILAWCDHEADPYSRDDINLTTYAAHAEELSHAPTGHHIVEWGGGWAESYEDGGGEMPDWWFVAGSEFEVVANPTHWMPLPAAPANPEDPAHAE